MENPFVIDWEEKKEAIIKDDYRDLRLYLGGALMLLPVGSCFILHFQNRVCAVTGLVLYGMSLVIGIIALAIFGSLRDFKKASTREAARKEYERLRNLCRKFPKTGELCRAAVADILTRQGFLTKWQCSRLVDDLKTLGDKERVEEFRTAFCREALKQGVE